MDAKKAAVLAVAALMLFYVVVDPTGAACVVEDVLVILQDAATGLFAFFREFLAAS
ncbi:MAG: hypothetical protein ACRDQF_21615 [Thermocrispum sp.]